MGRFIPRGLEELVRREYNLQVGCDCGHRSVISSADLLRLCHVKLWNTSLEVIGAHLKCRFCGRRPDEVRYTKAKPTTQVGPQSQAELDRLIRRLRG